MLHCWNFNPESRPLFQALEGRFRKLLDVGVAQVLTINRFFILVFVALLFRFGLQYYIDLNDHYVQMNNSNLTEGQTDYLSYMVQPDVMAPSVPSYLPMKPILGSNECRTECVNDTVCNPGYVASGEWNMNVIQNQRNCCDNPTYFDVSH